MMHHWLDAGRQGWRSFQQRGFRGVWQQMPLPHKIPQWFEMPKRMIGHKLPPFGPPPKGPQPELKKGPKAGPPHVQPPKGKPAWGELKAPKGEPIPPKEIKTPKGPLPPKPEPKGPKPELKGHPPADKAPRPEAKGPKGPEEVKGVKGPEVKGPKGPEVKGPKPVKPDEERMADIEARLKALEIKLDRLLDQPPGPPVDRRGPDGRGPARGGPPGRR